jgi:UDP-N-acetylmuramate dehydrogenase
MSTPSALDQRLFDRLTAIAGPAGVKLHTALAPLTTFHVGGPADYLVEARDAHQVVETLAAAREANVAVTVLGGGSNVLIGDRGIRGIVLLARDRSVTREDAQIGHDAHGRDDAGEARDAQAARSAPSPDAAAVLCVRAGAGLTINGLVRWTIGQGLAGLEAWAGTPGTVGGAIYGNAHFQGRNIGDLVREVRLVSRAGDVRDVPASDMAFGYDTSRLQRSGEVLLSTVFNVTPGEPDALRATARASLAFRKRTQPLDVPSAGCIFQNPDPAREAVPAGIPPSAGALIDRAGLKGSAEGDARVSPAHGNFIVHEGAASAAEIRALIERCKASVSSRFGVHLREEIVYLGEF